MLTDYVCCWEKKPWKMTLKTFYHKMSPRAFCCEFLSLKAVIALWALKASVISLLEKSPCMIFDACQLYIDILFLKKQPKLWGKNGLDYVNISKHIKCWNYKNWNIFRKKIENNLEFYVNMHLRIVGRESRFKLFVNTCLFRNTVLGLDFLCVFNEDLNSGYF